ncbi:MAG: lipoprotein-releasing ABC transporter permease subunit [Alphaproteobacteria bacterium]
MKRLERMLAQRYLKARRGFISLTSWLAIIGMALGVATLILVTSLMNGIRADMTQRFIGIGGHATIERSYGIFTDYDAVKASLADTPGVTAITPKIEGQVMATYRGRALGALVVALPWDTLALRPLFMNALKAGDWAGPRDNEGVMLGFRLARSLGLQVGDEITLISPQGQATIAGLIPRMKSYRITGLLDFGMHAYDGSLIVMPFEEARVYFKQPESVSNLEVMVGNPNDATAVADALRERLGDEYLVSDWQQSNATVFQALLIQRNVMVVILTLIILVAAFNIISSLVMLVKEKRRDIAILRTMGASRGMIERVFLYAGFWIGGVGTLAGLALGLILAQNIDRIKRAIEMLTGQEILVENIYFLSTLPTRTDPREVLVILLVALTIAMLAAIYPARKASQLDPAEVLRDV